MVEEGVLYNKNMRLALNDGEMQADGLESAMLNKYINQDFILENRGKSRKSIIKVNRGYSGSDLCLL